MIVFVRSRGHRQRLSVQQNHTAVLPRRSGETNVADWPALSATVGLGNIAGVAIAISLGGPGAVFWLWVIAFFGMNLKFSSCTFSQLHRVVKKDGSILEGY
mgnify:CR=1 FL=1